MTTYLLFASIGELLYPSIKLDCMSKVLNTVLIAFLFKFQLSNFSMQPRPKILRIKSKLSRIFRKTSHKKLVDRLPNNSINRLNLS